jgi:two-component system, LuxR family, response regulator FixJ
MPMLGTQAVHVVDDDLATRFAIDAILRSVGYDVALYENGAEFLARLGPDMTGCVILDVRLPGLGGLEVQRRLVDSRYSLPVIFLTAHADVEMAVRAMKAGAIEFLTKPFREQDLLDAISCAMEASGARARELRERERAMRQVQSLSAREREIFLLLCEGRLGKQIAHDLNVSEATVKVHAQSVYRKLGARNRTHAAIIAREQGFG